MKRRSIQLKERRDEQIKVANQILDSATDDKPLTDDQRKLFDSIMAEVKVLNGDIERAEFLENSQRDSAPTAGDTQVRRIPSMNAGEPKEESKILVPWSDRARIGKLRAFRGEDAEQRAYASGQWIMATLFQNEISKKWCASHNIPMVKNASIEGNNTQGGFLVPDILERTIIDLREEYGTFRQIVRIHPMSSDFQTIPRRAGGLTAVPIGEGADITESTKTWSNVALTARKWAVLTKYSTELAEDAIISIAEDLAQEIAYAFAVAEDAAGFNGDGTATYHGITGVVTKFNNQVVAGTSTLKGALDATAGHVTFASIDITDLTNLTALLPKYALNRAVWICSQPAWSTVFQRLQAGMGGNTVTDIAGRMQYSYLGYPVVISQAMPTTLTTLTNTVALLFGDPYSAISMGVRRGVSLAVSDQRYFESDQLAIRGTERFDINVHDIGDTTTAGPLVALIFA